METFEKIEFRKSRDFSGIINATFTFVRHEFKKLGKCMIFIVGPPILLAALVYGSGDIDVLLGTQQTVSAQWFLYYFVYIGILMLAGPLMTGVVYQYIVLYMDRDDPMIEVNDVWKAVKKKYWRILFTLVGIGLAVGFIFVVSFAVMGILGMNFAAFLAFIAFFCFAAYLYIALSLALFALLRENIPISQAFSRSIELVRGHWWFTFGISVLMVIVQYSLSFIFLIPQYTLTFIISAHTSDGAAISTGYRAAFVAATLTANFGTYTFYCLPLIALAFQYNNLVERKEAAGLLKDIQAIGQETPDGP
ncbi:MAG: hypothetical protein ACE5IR_14585 [bacterium]